MSDDPRNAELLPRSQLRMGPLTVPARLAATGLAVGAQLTRSLAGNAVDVGRQVLDGAKDGRPANELAGIVVRGWYEATREVIEAGSAVGAGDVVRGMTSLTRPVTERLPAPLTRAMLLPTEAGIEDGRRELRRRGKELLDRSTELTSDEEHPAFGNILAQLAPDEARIIRLLAESGPQPMLCVVENNLMTRKSREVLRNVSLIGSEAGVMHPDRTPIYVDNLARLGLVHLRDFRVGDQADYELLYAQPEVKDLPEPSSRLTRPKMLHKGVELSEFGRRLWEACFS